MTFSEDMQPSTDGIEPLTGKNLRPWKPGQSGNPGGKSKKLEEIKALAKDRSKRALERIIELVESDDERIALMAAKEVLDRAWGKPKDAEDDDGKRNLTINIVKFDSEAHAAKCLTNGVTVRKFSDAS